MCDQQTTSRRPKPSDIAWPLVRQLPTLTTLRLYKNQITDRGLASLLAPPSLCRRADTSLHTLPWPLGDNQITDQGFAALASAIRAGELPALTACNFFRGNPASEEAQEAVRAALRARCAH